MTQKKINNIIRLVLYLLPFVYIIYFIVSFKGTGTTTSSLDAWISSFNSSIYNMSLFHSFGDWIYSNIFSRVNTNLSYMPIITFSYNYCFYIVLVEFLILFKNVLVWIFNVANAWLERGVNVGKGKE